MSKNKILGLIEEGLLEYYVSIDYTLNSGAVFAEDQIPYGGENQKYSKMANRILFKAKIESKKSLQAKVISLSKVSEKLAQLDNEMEGKVFSLFKKHIEKYGLAVNYRNFDSMSEEQMKEILIQLNHTSFLDDILSELDYE